MKTFNSFVHKFPTLFKLNSSGKIQVWDIQAQEDNGAGVSSIVTIFGQKDGKLQTSVVEVATGKNIGKSNETTAYQQACLEAHALWTKQQERKGYTLEIKDVNKDLRPGAEPMLAHRYDKSSDKITFPCYIQLKFDGHRCIAIYTYDLVDTGECKVELYSRQRKLITGLPHINEAIKNMISNIFYGAITRLVLDGELYNHDYKDKFEQLTGFIRSEEPKEGFEAVQYHIYDILDESGTKTQEERLSDLSLVYGDNKTNTLIKVPSVLVYDEDQLMFQFKAYRKEGYEGAILRNKDGLYEGKRSYNLQKVKEFDDKEFTIVDVKEGKGKMSGHAIFTCKTDNEDTFDVKLKGPMEKLAEIYKNRENYKQKNLTVMFQGYTEKGIPRFPVGLRIREDI